MLETNLQQFKAKPKQLSVANIRTEIVLVKTGITIR